MNSKTAWSLFLSLIISVNGQLFDDDPDIFRQTVMKKR